MNDLILANKVKTMTSLEISELVESRHDNVKRAIERMVTGGVISKPPTEDGPKSANGVVAQVYLLDKRSSLIVVAQLSPEFTARVVDRWQELEAKATFKLPATYSEALRALADETERREHAERTKAEIGSRREATAMATASAAVRKANQLGVQLDHLKDYATVKRMTMLYHGTPFDWRELKSASAIMHKPPVDVFDQNYGSVKSYHRDVWKAVYALDTDGNPALPEIDDNNLSAELN
jgi:phage regulator Rha-like protein